MPETFQIINMIVLVAAVWFGIHSLSKRDVSDKKKKADDQVEIERWERYTEIASQDKEYDPHKWYFKLPDSVLKHLEVCFDGDEKKVYTMKRCIELSIEHFATEMADDAECAKIIEERVYSNPKMVRTNSL